MQSQRATFKGKESELLKNTEHIITISHSFGNGSGNNRKFSIGELMVLIQQDRIKRNEGFDPYNNFDCTITIAPEMQLEITSLQSQVSLLKKELEEIKKECDELKDNLHKYSLDTSKNTNIMDTLMSIFTNK